jgi:hypothetical protein
MSFTDIARILESTKPMSGNIHTLISLMSEIEFAPDLTQLLSGIDGEIANR